MKEIRCLIILFIGLWIGACNDVKIESENSLLIGFKEKNPTFYENSPLNSILISLSAPAPYDITMEVQVRAEQNVQEGKDYFLHSKYLTIPKGKNYANVEVTFIDDRSINSPRSFELVLVAPSGIQMDVEGVTSKVTLLDDESDVAFSFEEPVFSCYEDAGEVFVPIIQEGPQNTDVKIWVAVKEVDMANPAEEGVHFTLTDTALLFLKEESRDNLGVRIALLPDGVISMDRTFVLEITKVFGGMKVVDKSACVVAIRNVDLGIWFETPTLNVEENPVANVPLKSVLTLSGNTRESLKITVEADGSGSAVEGTHFLIPTKQFTVPAGTESLEVEVLPLYDENITGDLNFKLKVSEIQDHPEIDLADLECGITLYDYDTDLTFSKVKSVVSDGFGSAQIAVSLSNPVKHPLSFTVKRGTSADLADNDYSLPAGVITLPIGITDTVFPVELLNAKTGYLDIQLEAASGIAVSHVSTADYRLTVTPNFDYGMVNRLDHGWSVPSVSSAHSEGGGVNSMLNNMIPVDLTKYWHSNYSTSAPLPHWAIIDMGKELGVFSVYAVRRGTTSYADTRVMEVYISKTATTENDPSWVKLGNMNFGDNPRVTTLSQHEQTLLVAPLEISGRYLKVKVTESNRAPNSGVCKVSIVGYEVQ